ncbi:hypothetical protein NHP21005_01710 [Helicobacter sp. NHP21005]|uniref:hypothetical protein n=1 Tax=Helicobacter felistomachi TaxID=3040201 RepID=UPI002572A988|nr:hypothetical protein [Helicobacter sp. NHP21005]BEG56483.1 hypothetical protein NHP21005_01710 [Helicobacter sp. NHP21005]
MENLSLAEAINERIGLYNVKRYRPLLKLEIDDIVDALSYPNAWFAKSLGRNQWRFDAFAYYTSLRVFAKPYDRGYTRINAEGEVESGLRAEDL